MKILFDNRWCGDHGIGRFSREVIAHLENVELMPAIGYPSSPYDPVYIAWQIFKDKPDVFFSPGFNAPIAGKTPFVFTLCDLNHLATEENGTPLKRAYYELIIKPACHRARKIITVSNFSKQAIIQWSGVSESKVVNVGVGVDNAFTPFGDRIKMQAPYLLYVGNNKPHKNLERLIKAYEQSGHADCTLLIITGFPTPSIEKYLHCSDYANNIKFIGKIRETDLPRYYRGAEGLVFPSTYEGFGLPVLEAMACGTPVLTSNTSALPEVAGDAAILVDPYSIDDISHGIKRLLSDKCETKTNIDKGLKKATLYSWANTANKVQEALFAA